MGRGAMTLRLRIGGDREIVNPGDPSSLKFLATEGAHEAIFSFLIAVAGFSSLVDVYKSSSAEGPKPWPEDHYATFDGLLCDITLRWKPNLVIFAAVMNGIPNEIEFEEYQLAPKTAENEVNLGALNHFFFGTSQMMIVSYYEKNRRHIEDRFGKIDNWPPVWQFARMVRNAVSHGNKVNIIDGKSATWKGLTYSPASQGRIVINSDLFPADLIIMLRELEDSL